MTCEFTCDCDACTISARVADVLREQYPAREDGKHEINLGAVVRSLSTHIGFALSVAGTQERERQLIDLMTNTIMEVKDAVYRSGGGDDSEVDS